MKALFVELPAFERNRENYLDDAGFRRLQLLLLANPEAGEVMEGTGGLRKLRYGDVRRGKGRRGGLRAIYFWWPQGKQFWVFTLFGKDEVADLTPFQRQQLKEMIKNELKARSPQ